MLNKKIFVTGSSGFIGFHVCKILLANNFTVIGIDNHNNYYDVKLKQKRLKILKKNKKFFFYKIDIKNKIKLNKIFIKHKPKIIIHLAAQAGVRYSFINPQEYIDSNITGFTNILQIMKANNLNNLIYASSSSVYGNCKTFPYKETLDLNPLNFYGQTKLFNEKIANIYEKNFKIKTIGLRFFTIYGPFGRPDMFIPKIIKKIKKGQKIELYNNGNHERDFTYVGDVAQIILSIVKNIKKKIKNSKINVCNSNNISIKKVIKLIEKETDKKVKVKNKPFQMGDMLKTHGSNRLLKKNFKIKKFTNFSLGIKKTLEQDFFNVS